jgi:hypothetical protein
MPVTWSDVTRLLRAEPSAVREPGKRTWKVDAKLVAWERPLRKTDLEHLGAAAPTGDILGVYVPLEVKDELVASGKHGYFTTPHFNGYAAILVAMTTMNITELKRLLAFACMARASAETSRRKPGTKRARGRRASA